MKHTDWRLLRQGVEIHSHPDEAYHEIQCGKHSALVAQVPLVSSGRTYGERGATVITAAQALEHARLMTAAPKLLAALTRMYRVHAGSASHTGDGPLGEAAAALEAATGVRP